MFRSLTVAAALAGASAATFGQAFEKMDETWTVMVNGQSAHVEPDGSFTIPSVTAPDQFGPGGPGTAPDFVSDDFLRVIGTSTAGGRTRYAYSERFQFRRGQPISVGMMTITDTPPPFPQSIRIEAQGLIEVGQSATLQVLGRLVDGSEIDVTSTGTTFRTSNTAILSVNEQGTFTANGPGLALITALNEGATAVKQVRVTTAIRRTTVTGIVVDQSLTAVPMATVECPGGESTLSTGNGSFAVECQVAGDDETVFVSARATRFGEQLSGNSMSVPIVFDGFTDVGFVVLQDTRSVLVLSNDSLDNDYVVTEFMSRMPGLTFVAFDADSTPSQAFLRQFDTVLLFENTTFTNNTSVGNALFDYLQQGGNVVIGVFYWQGRSDGGFNRNWGMLETIDPCTTLGVSPYSQGSLDPASIVVHPLTQGIQSLLVGNYRGDVVAKPETTVVARWQDGVPMLCYKELDAGQRVVVVSSFPPTPRYSVTVTGDYYRMWENALRWSAERGAGMPVLLREGEAGPRRISPRPGRGGTTGH